MKVPNIIREMVVRIGQLFINFNVAPKPMMVPITPNLYQSDPSNKQRKKYGNRSIRLSGSKGQIPLMMTFDPDILF